MTMNARMGLAVSGRGRTQRVAGLGKLLARTSLVVALACAAAGHATAQVWKAHSVPLFVSASNPSGHQGFVRIINRSDAAGAVRIDAFDDAGVPHGPVTLDIGANETVHINSRDLEDGNAGKGLSGGVGKGTGDWRLRLRSRLDLEVLAYNRTRDGLLAPMHGRAPRAETHEAHRVATFNPASNASQISRLRIINPGGQPAAVTVTGVDDTGASPGAGVTLTVAPRAARTLTAKELESGDAKGLAGMLGDGKGKWRLVVTADRPVEVMSLMSSPTGHLVNLSAGAPAGVAVPAAACAAVNIPDPYLRAAVARQLGKLPGAPISPAEMASMTYLTSSHALVRDLAGLECATALHTLNLHGTQISNLGPLSRLTALTRLNLQHNQISSIAPLSRLTALTQLNLQHNQISNIGPLSGLTVLTHLYLEENRISNIAPLSRLTALTQLNLQHNQISSIGPLSGLTSLTDVALSHNRISNIAPLVSNRGLGRGNLVWLFDNPLSARACNVHVPLLESRGVRVIENSCPDE